MAKANLGVRTRPNVLVLESVWQHDDLGSRLSVVPFLEGWASVAGLRVGFRTYHGSSDLTHWLEEFAHSKSNPHICYIAGHGGRRRLAGVAGSRDINMVSLLTKVFPRRRGRPAQNGTKGILIGSCKTGGKDTRERILNRTSASLAWIAGYDKIVPWWDCMVADLMFLSYLSFGRRREFDQEKQDYRYRATKSAEQAAKWLTDAFQAAKELGFGASERH